LATPGNYVFRLTVADNGGATGRASVTVTVNPPANIPPTANAGPDQSITRPKSFALLTGSGSDSDGYVAAYAWTQVSGPATAAIANPSSSATIVTGLSVPGTYVFRLTATDDAGATSSDETAVAVGPAIVLSDSYVLVDLSGGTSVASYPVTNLSSVPADLLTNTGGPGGNSIYKTTHLVLRRIPAGTFTMGSPVTEIGRGSNETQHQVTLTHDFFMGVFDVTQEQYRLVTGLSPSYYSGNPANPVETVSWRDVRGADANWQGGTQWPDANTFLGLISAKTNLAFDLPTEAQWEYACRAGTTTALNNGQNLTSGTQDAAADAVAWYVHNSPSVHAVGFKQPNAWGLYDMHGNVFELCLDWSALWPPKDYAATPVTDPLGDATGSYCVLRGGCFWRSAGEVRSAYRSMEVRGYGFNNFGFRVVVHPGP
jgi:formylglycine-generating enzyme required for sulfatase activity